MAKRVGAVESDERDAAARTMLAELEQVDKPRDVAPPPVDEPEDDEPEEGDDDEDEGAESADVKGDSENPPLSPEEAGADFGWAIFGVLALLVWFMSAPGPKAVARLAKAKRFAERAGQRLGARVGRALGLWLTGLSLVAEGVAMLVGEKLGDDAPGPASGENVGT